MNNHATITVTPNGLASLDHVTAVAFAHAASRHVSLTPAMPPRSIAQRTALDYISHRASLPVDIADFDYTPAGIIFAADVPTPAAPAAAVH